MILDLVDAFHMESMMVLVILMINAKIICFVDTEIVQLHLMKIITVVQTKSY